MQTSPELRLTDNTDCSEYLEWLDGSYRPVAGGALESNILGLWFAKQTAKGSPVTFTAGTMRARWVGGDFQTNRADGTEQWSDQTLFADAVDFVNTIIGNGAPVLQGQSNMVAYMSWLGMGQESVSGGVSAVLTLAETGAPTGGTFTLSFNITWPGGTNTYTTAPIQYNATGVTIAAAIQAAIPLWTSATITGSATAISVGAVTLTFGGALANQPIPLPTVNYTGLTGGTSPTITAGATVTLTSTGGATGGTFTATFVVNGVSYTTAGIAYNAAASAVATAVATAVTPFGAVAGSGGALGAAAVVLSITGSPGVSIPVPTINATGLTGGTSPGVTPTGTGGMAYTHVATPADTGGFFFGAFKSVGKSVIARHQYNDCRMQSLRLEGSSASKVVKATPTVLSLDPGHYQTGSADPSTVDSGARPFIYTEAQGTFAIDGTVYTGQSAFAVMFTWGLNEYYGDNVIPQDVINNVATCTIEGLTLLIDANGLLRYNSQIYGTPTPTANQAPITGIPLMGSYSCLFTRVNPLTGQQSESLKLEIFGVKWDPSLAIPANPAGGAVELSFTGAMRKTPGGAYIGQTGLPPFRVTTNTPLFSAFTS